MKIKAENARWFQKHLDAIGDLTGRSDTMALYKRLRRLEARLNRLAVAWCNGEIEQEQWETACVKPQAELDKLFSGRTVHLNGDPRGYTIKVSGNLPINTPTDWGGDFCPGQEF